MFLHQLFKSSNSRWKPSDTERLLSSQTPSIIRVNGESDILLSDVLKPPGRALSHSYVSLKAMSRIIRRAKNRSRTFRVLLRTHDDTIPATVTFGSHGTDGSESWTLTSVKSLQGSHQAGLMVFLKRSVLE